MGATVCILNSWDGQLMASEQRVLIQASDSGGQGYGAHALGLLMCRMEAIRWPGIKRA